MSEAQQQSEPPLIDLDLCIRVAKHSFLSPGFSCFVPLLYIGLGGHTSDALFWSICAYLLFTFVLWAVPMSSAMYSNWHWRNDPRLDWENQIVLITGAADGLGRTIAETLAIRNVTVVAVDVHPAEYDYDDVYFYQCDISDREAVFKLAETVKKEVGAPTILINNAGVARGGSVLNTSEQTIRKTFEVNAMGPFWTTQAFLPDMLKAPSAHIVTVASALSYTGIANLAAYTASKAAHLSFHEALTTELAQANSRVRTSVVCPGFIQTKLFAFFGANGGQTPLQSFFAPPVSPHDLTKKIIASLDAQINSHICMPFYVNGLPLMRILPSWATDAARKFFNSDGRVDASGQPSKPHSA